MTTNQIPSLIERKFEHRNQQPLKATEFFIRLLKFFLMASALISLALGIGILGYHYFESLSWLDAFLNASMILGGMGPVNALQTTGGKIFAGIYALSSGLIFVVCAGLLLSPLLHRLLHKFHFDADLLDGEEYP